MRTRVYAARYGLFTVGTMISALGIALVTNAHLGTTPITSLPYTLAAICGLSLGAWTFIVNLAFVAGQKVLLGPDFKLSALVQLLAVLVFSLFIDLWMRFTAAWNPSSYAGRVAMSLAGSAVLALGISVQLVCQATVQPGEGMVLALAYRLRKEFGNLKVLFDVTLVATAAGLGFFLLGGVVGLREGTLLSALTVGLFVRFFGRWTRRLAPLMSAGGERS